MPGLVSLAAALLIAQSPEDRHIIDQVKRLYKSIAGVDVSEEALKEFFKAGGFNVQLPKAKPLEFDDIEKLQERAVAILRSA